MSDPRNRNPGPWSFHVHRYGLGHVIVDADGRYITSNVPIGSGPLLAAGPELLAALEHVAEVTTPGTEAHELATRVIESFREGEAMVLVDWRPEPIPPARRRQLRIAGVAT
jgi:hypothetical protein